MEKKYSIIIVVFLLVFYFPNKHCLSQLPLITDNAGTMGKNKGQLELSNGVGFQNEHRCIEKTTEINTVLTYGIFNKTDIILSYPFLFISKQDDLTIENSAGFSDLSLEIKYCILKYDNFSQSIKPGLTFPTGDFSEKLGSGKISGSSFFISSFDISPIIINGNIGYLRNSNKCGEAMDIWHISADIDYLATESLHIVLNPGIEKNPDLLSETPPSFCLLGLYYCLNNFCEICLAYKHGLTMPETEHAFIYGLTLRY